MTQVIFKTNKGDITVEVDHEKAPIGAENFVHYAMEGFYNGTIFHRVIPNFMVQGGGMLPGMEEKPTGEPIENEAYNGLKNLRGSLSYARTQDPHSATTQFFMNLVDNESLDHTAKDDFRWGYAVFGQITDGLEIIDDIAKVETTNRRGHDDVPVDDIIVEKCFVLQDDEIKTMKKVIITADIHLLTDDNHPINQNFYQFLKTDVLDEVTELYLIGDLFEVWIGDDINLPEYKTVIKLLKDLTSSGLKIYLQYGNRDFLMGDDFWQATGITKLTEPTLIQLNGIQAILVHGDSLCTDDIDYQRMRKWFRNPIIQWLFLKLPQKTRIKIGEKMRQQSQQHISNKADVIMAVNQQAVAELFKQYPDCNNLIHGHTHQLELHTFRLNKHTKHRWALKDWRPKAEYIVITDKIEFKSS